jgi:alpha-tubulin suppressor-like RCC1 family protein
VTGITQIRHGGLHGCLLHAEQNVSCWGFNERGQIGDGTQIHRFEPVAVNGLEAVESLAVGYWHTCASNALGQVRCWGYNGEGQLGDDSGLNASTPRLIENLPEVRSLVAGEYHTCALLRDSTVVCWGSGRGVWGCTASREYNLLFTPVRDLEGVVQIAAAGDGMSCARLEDGSLHCWGYNDLGQLGNGGAAHQQFPRPVSGLPPVLIDMGLSGTHSCAVSEDGSVYCWGANCSNQLGIGSATCNIDDNPQPIDTH